MKYLINYRTDETIRQATTEEIEASEAQKKLRPCGGVAVLKVDGVLCYVE